MALERTYTVPLRREWLKVPRYRRAKKAITALKQFLTRHMKSEDVRIQTKLNQEIWKDGIRSPPSRIKITAQKDNDGVVRAQLFGVAFEKAIVKKAVEEDKGLMGKLKKKMGATDKKEAEEVKTEAKKEEPKVEAKEEKEAEVKKEETKAAPVKKEAPKEEKKPVPKEKPKVEKKAEEKPKAPTEKKEEKPAPAKPVEKKAEPEKKEAPKKEPSPPKEKEEKPKAEPKSE